MNKFLKALPVLTVLMVLFLSCAQSKNGRVTSEYLNRKWMLKSLDGVTNEQALEARSYIDLEDIAKSGGYAGCNKIFFTTKTGSKNAISFTGIGSTRMYCEKFMTVETAYLKALEKIVLYELSGHQAKFLDKNGKVLINAVAADWD